MKEMQVIFLHSMNEACPTKLEWNEDNVKQMQILFL